jgi:hypothetical protein
VAALFPQQAHITTGEGPTADGDGDAKVCIVSIDSLPTAPHAGQTVIAVSEQDDDLAGIVALMAKRPWFNHVVSQRILDAGDHSGSFRESIGRLLGIASSGFLENAASSELTLWDSAKRSATIRLIVEAAHAAGASSLAANRIRDVAEEILTNALYDAQAEKTGKETDRSTRVLIEQAEACRIRFSTWNGMFFLQVTDCCGSLRRERLFEALQRCAVAEDVQLDTSRGGAGLGMWRIFSAASVLILQVQPGVTTEFTVGLELQRARVPRFGRNIHLFFGSNA